MKLSQIITKQHECPLKFLDCTVLFEINTDSFYFTLSVYLTGTPEAGIMTVSPGMTSCLLNGIVSHFQIYDFNPRKGRASKKEDFLNDSLTELSKPNRRH